MAAAGMAEDIEKGAVPPEYGQIEELGKNFGKFFTKQADVSADEYNSVDLPPFLKDVLLGITKKALSRETTESLK